MTERQLTADAMFYIETCFANHELDLVNEFLLKVYNEPPSLRELMGILRCSSRCKHLLSNWNNLLDLALEQAKVQQKERWFRGLTKA